MSGKLFLKNHLPVILLNLLGALALSLFLLAVGNDIQTVLFLLTAWMLVLALYLAAGYVSRKKRLERLLEMAGQLKERYLLPEVMPVPDQAEEQVYYQLLKLAGKSLSLIHIFRGLCSGCFASGCGRSSRSTPCRHW